MSLLSDESLWPEAPDQDVVTPIDLPRCHLLDEYVPFCESVAYVPLLAMVAWSVYQIYMLHKEEGTLS